MRLSKRTKFILYGFSAICVIGGALAYYLIPKPPETRFLERWQIDVNATLEADTEFNALGVEAQTSLRVVTQDALAAKRYEFTEDGLLLFGPEGQLLPIARYTVNHVNDDGVDITLDYLGLREGVSEGAQLRYSSLRGMTLMRGQHTTVLARD